MDLSFAGQLNAMLWMTKHGKDLKPAVYEFLKVLRIENARAKLEIMDISIEIALNRIIIDPDLDASCIIDLEMSR